MMTKAAVVIIVMLAGAQFIRPDHANPATDSSRSIQAQVGTTSELIPVLNRACGNCHSNETAWPWYTEVAPLSWLWAYGVREGRRVVNFSEWAAYSPAQQRTLLAQSCRDASSGKMPGGIYTALRPEARLSAHDVDAICMAARQTNVSSLRGVLFGASISYPNSTRKRVSFFFR